MTLREAPIGLQILDLCDVKSVQPAVLLALLKTLSSAFTFERVFGGYEVCGNTCV